MADATNNTSAKAGTVFQPSRGKHPTDKARLVENAVPETSTEVNGAAPAPALEDDGVEQAPEGTAESQEDRPQLQTRRSEAIRGAFSC
jgi:hypothetical protein